MTDVIYRQQGSPNTRIHVKKPVKNYMTISNALTQCHQLRVGPPSMHQKLLQAVEGGHGYVYGYFGKWLWLHYHSNNWSLSIIGKKNHLQISSCPLHHYQLFPPFEVILAKLKPQELDDT